MNGRQRIARAAGGHQPARLWELDRDCLEGDARETWRRADGYRVSVWYTAAGSVRCAVLVSPAGMRRHLVSRDGGKVAAILGWLYDPTAYLKPPAPAS